MQGIILTADQVAQQLQEANRNYQGFKTWEQMYSNVELNRLRSLGALQQQYGGEMNTAFVSAQQQANAIQASNLGQGYKDLALEQNEATLNEAFESYKANYLANESQINQSAQQATGEIDALLSTQAQNMADYTNAHYEYLQWLYKNNPDAFANDANFAKYVKDGQLISTEELSAGLFDIDPITGTGPLNERGVDFFKQMENAGLALGAGNSFADYLLSSERGRKLFDWAVAADPYNMGKNNVGTWQELTGTEGDYTTTSSSFTDEEWSNINQKFLDKVTSWETMLDKNGGKKANAKAIASEMFDSISDDGTVTAGAFTELREHIKSLGIEDEIGVMLTDGWQGFEKRINSYKNIIDDPSGEGTNKQNREWAVNEAIRAYQDLYNLMNMAMSKSDWINMRDSLKSPQERAQDYKDYFNTSDVATGTQTLSDGTEVDVSVGGAIPWLIKRSQEAFASFMEWLGNT